MVYFKSCPKCRGDMFPSKDEFGSYRHCAQCGFTAYTVEEPTIASQANSPGS